MAYEFYLGDLLLPVSPSSLQVKIKNQNETVKLINEMEFNFVKTPGLTEFEFDALIPAVKYPFANYHGDFKNPKYYLDRLEKFKTNKERFVFKVWRDLPDGTRLYDNDNMWVTLEEYTVKEEAANGFDITVSITLKEFNTIQTEILKVFSDCTASVEKQRETDKSPKPKNNQSYTVKSGDTLWALAKKYYGDGKKYTAIAKANPSIKNPNLIHVGQVLTIPAL